MSNPAYQSSCGSEFEQKASAPNLSALRQYLPRLSLNQTFTIDALVSSGQKYQCKSLWNCEQGRKEDYEIDQEIEQKTMLSGYLRHYGFDNLQRKYSEVDYYFGTLSMNDELVEFDREFRLATHIWRPKLARGLVFIAHGLFDHIGLYLQLVDFLLGQQYAVIAIDLPGHGLSSGDQGTITDFKDYALAIRCVNIFVQENASCLLINEKKEGLDYFAVGQSTGCASLIKYVNLESEYREYNNTDKHVSFIKLALIAPLVRPKSWWFIRVSFAILSVFLKSIKRKFTWNSHDDVFTQFIAKHDPLQPTKISVEWVGAMITWVKTFQKSQNQSMPILVLQGTGDKTVDFAYNLPAIKAKFRNCQLEMIDGARHHFVNESDQYRAKGFDYIGAFFSEKNCQVKR